MKKAQPKKRTARWILLALLNLIVLAALAFLYYQHRILPYQERIAQIEKTMPYVLAGRILSDPGLAEEGRSSLLEMAAMSDAHANGKGRLAELYRLTDGDPLFFSGLKPSGNYTILLSRIDELDLEGIDQAPYDVPGIRKDLGELGRKRSDAMQSPQFVFSPRERENLFYFLRELESNTPDQMPEDGEDLLSLLKLRGEESLIEVSLAGHEILAKKTYRDLLLYRNQLDLRLASNFLRLAEDLGPVRDEPMVPDLSLAARDLETAIRDFEPRTPQYRKLMRQVQRYMHLASSSRFQPMDCGGKLKLGDLGEQAAALQRRLAAEGFYGGPVTGEMDAETVGALTAFQQRHGMKADGVMGRHTCHVLNVPFGEKVRRIRHAIKRLRHSEARKFEQEFFVRINIPEFMLQVWDGGEVIDEHRVIIGQGRWAKPAMPEVPEEEKDPDEEPPDIGPINQTPLLHSFIREIILNPRWYVSNRIKAEIDTELEKDPDYYEKHAYVTVIDEEGEERIYQESGTFNTLGRVKIKFFNRYAIFMHDTNARGLFRRPRRDLSHGCIRVDRALTLTRTLLKKDGKTKILKKLREILEEQYDEHIVKLKKPVPLVIEYVSVVVDADGKIHFIEDIYGLNGPGPAGPPGI